MKESKSKHKKSPKEIQVNKKDNSVLVLKNIESKEQEKLIVATNLKKEIANNENTSLASKKIDSEATKLNLKHCCKQTEIKKEEKLPESPCTSNFARTLSKFSKEDSKRIHCQNPNHNELSKGEFSRCSHKESACIQGDPNISRDRRQSVGSGDLKNLNEKQFNEKTIRLSSNRRVTSGLEPIQERSESSQMNVNVEQSSSSSSNRYHMKIYVYSFLQYNNISL